MAERLVLSILAGCAEQDKGKGTYHEAWPSQETILARIGNCITLRYLRRILDSLERKGMFVRHHREGGSGRSVRYCFPGSLAYVIRKKGSK